VHIIRMSSYATARGGELKFLQKTLTPKMGRQNAPEVNICKSGYNGGSRIFGDTYPAGMWDQGAEF